MSQIKAEEESLRKEFLHQSKRIQQLQLDQNTLVFPWLRKDNTIFIVIIIFILIMMMSKRLHRIQYEEQPYSFAIITTYLRATLVNYIPFTLWPASMSIVSDMINITPLLDTFKGLLFNIAHPFFSPPCNWILNKYGMKIAFILGGIFTIDGIWLSCFQDTIIPLTV